MQPLTYIDSHTELPIGLSDQFILESLSSTFIRIFDLTLSYLFSIMVVWSKRVSVQTHNFSKTTKHKVSQTFLIMSYFRYKIIYAILHR